MGSLPTSSSSSLYRQCYSSIDDRLLIFHGPRMYGCSKSCNIRLRTRWLLSILLVDGTRQQDHQNTSQRSMVQHHDRHPSNSFDIRWTNCNWSHFQYRSPRCLRSLHHPNLHQNILRRGSFPSRTLEPRSCLSSYRCSSLLLRYGHGTHIMLPNSNRWRSCT